MKISSRIHALWLLAMLLLAGCSSYRPWSNSPLSQAQMSPAEVTGRQVPSVMVAVTLSGGGARAAAFGLGVLRELKATSFVVDGRPTTLLDNVVLISAVSGGSILAAHFAAFGDETLERFEPDFLLQPFEGMLIREALWPRGLYRLTSPWYGRSQMLADRLDGLYRGKTFGDVRRRAGAPDLMITATDLTTGAPFDFTPEQFGLICSDLAATPLSFAVAASSAVPVLLSPVTLRNFADRCPYAGSPEVAGASDADYRVRMMRRSAESYRNAQERPYIHLVDGGVADNLGVRLILDRLAARGSVSSALAGVPPGSVHRIVLITVNSERDLAERVDANERVPTTTQVMESLLFGAGSRASQLTLAMLGDDLLRWREEIQRTRGTSSSPFAADAEFHVINVSLHDVQDDKVRHSLLRVPTAFTVEVGDVRALQRAGEQALRDAPALRELKESLRALGEPLP